MTHQCPYEVNTWAQRILAQCAAIIAQCDADDAASVTFKGRAEIAKRKLRGGE